MVIVEQYGMLWKMSQRKFALLIRWALQGKEYNLDDFGKRIGEITHRMPCDWTKEDWKEMAQRYNKCGAGRLV